MKRIKFRWPFGNPYRARRAAVRARIRSLDPDVRALFEDYADLCFDSDLYYYFTCAVLFLSVFSLVGVLVVLF